MGVDGFVEALTVDADGNVCTSSGASATITESESVGVSGSSLVISCMVGVEGSSTEVIVAGSL